MTTEPLKPPTKQEYGRSVGLMRLGGALLALAVQSIREVIPGQPFYRALPIKAEGLLGAVSLRGTIVPVLDLRPTLGLPVAALDNHIVVIMRWENRLIGLAADEVGGIVRLEGGDLFALGTANAAPGARLATHTFQTGGDIATLIDAKAIAELPNVPLIAEQAVGVQSGQSTIYESILLLSCGVSHFGVDAKCVDATVPRTRIDRNPLANGCCLGVIDHHGQEVAVVDTLRALGLGGGERREEAAVVVIRFPQGGLLGFVLDEVHDIARVTRSQILAMPPIALDNARFFGGMLEDRSGRRHLLIDANLIRADPYFALLASFCKPIPAIRQVVGPGVTPSARKLGGRTVPFLTYVAGAERATLLTQISEILVFPVNLAPFEIAASGLLGLFTHRGRAAPLICLSMVLGRPSAFNRKTARVLVVEDGDATVGFVVQALHSIETVELHSSPSFKTSDANPLFDALVMLGLKDQRRMTSHVDLTAHAKAFMRRGDLYAEGSNHAVLTHVA